MSLQPKYDEKTGGEIDVNVLEVNDGSEHAERHADVVDEGYLTMKQPKRFYRSVLFQMLMFGALSFVGPSMSDAISGLGGGGLSSPYISNLASSLNYVGSCVITIFGGPLINKIGIKWSCLIAAVAFPLNGSAYYCSAKFGIHTSWTQGYLLAAKLINGVTSGFLYVAETTAMLSYPYLQDRGFYLGIWSGMRNSGSVLGGAINFSVNNADSGEGGVAWSTYLIFVGFEASGPIFALLLSQTRKVRRKDGSHVPSTGKLSWKDEFIALGRHLRHRRTWLMALPAFYSFFYGGVYGTYLSNHFSVRSRALSSLVYPCVVILMVVAYGKFVLDNQRMSIKTRAWVSVGMWVIPQAAGLIWTGIIYGRYGKTTVHLDYGLTRGAWAAAYLPYLIMFCSGYWTQICLYWLLATFSSDVKSSSRTGGLFRAFETAGQAVSYGINSSSKDIRIPFFVLCGLYVIVLPCVYGLIREVPNAPTEFDDIGDPSSSKAIVMAEAD